MKGGWWGGGGDDNEIPLREKGKADMHTRQGGRLDPRGGDQPVQPPQWTRETKRTHKRAESDSLSTLPATVSRDEEQAACSSTFTKASFSIVLNI